MSDREHPVVARLYDPIMAIPERTVLVEHREYLVSGLSGNVLDLGAGTGASFPYFEREGGDIQVTAIEPDPHMRKRAHKRAATLDIDIDVVDARAEELPYEDNEFDAVVSAFVFCTVDDPEQSLSEVARVLKRGGKFRFVEHVRADGAVGKGHDVLAPCWHAVAGGCNLNRRTDQLFLGDERFQIREYEQDGGSRLLPIVRGTLSRQRRSIIPRSLDIVF